MWSADKGVPCDHVDDNTVSNQQQALSDLTSRSFRFRDLSYRAKSFTDGKGASTLRYLRTSVLTNKAGAHMRQGNIPTL